MQPQSEHSITTVVTIGPPSGTNPSATRPIRRVDARPSGGSLLRPGHLVGRRGAVASGQWDPDEGGCQLNRVVHMAAGTRMHFTRSPGLCGLVTIRLTGDSSPLAHRSNPPMIGSPIPELLEADITGGGLFEDLEPADLRLWRSVAAPGNQAGHRIGRSLEAGFDAAIGQVAYPSGDALLASNPTAALAEEDALHGPGDEDPTPDHLQTLATGNARASRRPPPSLPASIDSVPDRPSCRGV
jgi:hypothetical protein